MPIFTIIPWNPHTQLLKICIEFSQSLSFYKGMKTNLHLYKTSKCYLHHIFESFQFIKANYNSHQPIDHNFVVLPKSIEKLFPYSPSCFSNFSQNAPTHLPKAPFHQYCLTNTPPPPPLLPKILNKTSCKSIHEISPPSQNLWQKSYTIIKFFARNQKHDRWKGKWKSYNKRQMQKSSSLS